jgi:hypothetical protein
MRWGSIKPAPTIRIKQCIVWATLVVALQPLTTLVVALQPLTTLVVALRPLTTLVVAPASNDPCSRLALRQRTAFWMRYLEDDLWNDGKLSYHNRVNLTEVDDRVILIKIVCRHRHRIRK